MLPGPGVLLFQSYSKITARVLTINQPCEYGRRCAIPDYAAIVTKFRSLAIEAGVKIMEIYERPDFEVETKADESPVTEADKAADALISAGLKAAFPEMTLVTKNRPPAIRLLRKHSSS